MSVASDEFVSIVLPVLNEPYLPSLLQKLNESVFHPYEIIIVTSDKTKKPLEHGSFNVRVFKSYGDSLERAILLGFSVAKGNKIIVMDADGSHPPQMVNALVEALDSYEMAVASRFVKGGCYHTTFLRYLTSAVYTKYAQLLGSTLADPMSGFFGVRRRLLDGMRFKPFVWKTALEINNKLRPKTLELPYTFLNRCVGHSHSSWLIGVRILWDILEAAL